VERATRDCSASVHAFNAFDRFDKNSDGYLSMLELEETNTSEELAQESERFLRQNYDVLSAMFSEDRRSGRSEQALSRSDVKMLRDVTSLGFNVKDAAERDAERASNTSLFFTIGLPACVLVAGMWYGAGSGILASFATAAVGAAATIRNYYGERNFMTYQYQNARKLVPALKTPDSSSFNGARQQGFSGLHAASEQLRGE